jgi:triacylglycerol lipase
MTTLNKQDYANICEFAYDDPKKINSRLPVRIPSNDPNGKYYFIHVMKSDKESDMQGFLLERTDKDGKHTGEFITAFRGSEGWTDWKGNLGFIGVFKGKGEHPQISTAIKFAEEAQTFAKAIANKNHTPYSMVNTGHSLGGMCAQVATAVNGAPAVTFNPLPITLARSWAAAIKSHANKIENHVMGLDPANALVANLPGNTFRYTNSREIQALRKNGYNTPTREDDNLTGIASELASSHSITNFTGKHSVLLSGVNQELAKQHKQEIDRFRAEIAEFGASPAKKTQEIIHKEYEGFKKNINDDIDNLKDRWNKLDLRNMFSENEMQLSPSLAQTNKEFLAKLAANNVGSNAVKPNSDIENNESPSPSDDFGMA